MPNLKRSAALVGAAVAVAVLAACTPAPSPVGTSAGSARSVPQGAVSPGEAEMIANDPFIAEQPREGACADLQGLASGSAVGGYGIIEMRDLGPAPHATGEATLNDDGTPAAYVVADGDTVFAIARRFCIDHTPYLEWINSARRSDSWQWAKGDGDFAIYPGDTLNLDPHMITSVGDERGVVYDHTPDFNIPPQR